MSNTVNNNRRHRSYDVQEWKFAYCDSHNGYRKSGKWGKRQSDRWARREGKREIALALASL